ncbi:MAG: cytochrome b/b6 domain-containing protein [Burkholderiaceae bacterium]
MNASPSLDARSRGHDTGALASRRVVDAPTRAFHWLFALSFAGAYVTAESEHWRLLHTTLGYVFAGLLAFRLVYGLVGPRHAGLALLWRKLTVAPSWLKSLRGAPSLAAVRWRPGQNLGMALAVATMIALAVPLALTGLAADGGWGGALAGDAMAELHEFFGSALLLAAGAHLALIALLSVLRGHHQALSMLTGRVPGAGPSPVSRDRAALAAMLVLAVIALGAWRWQDAPRGPRSPQWSATTLESPARGDHRDARHARDDDD